MKGDKFITLYGRKVHIEGAKRISLCGYAWTSDIKPGKEVKPNSLPCRDCFRIAGKNHGPIYVKPKLTKYEPAVNLKYRKGKRFYDVAQLLRWNRGV